MTFREFETLLKEDPSLQKKFKEAKQTVKTKETKEQAIALSKVILSLGYSVPADDISLYLIGSQKLDDKELEAVGGGVSNMHHDNDCDDVHTAKDEGRCVADYVDTDCWGDDFCDFLRLDYSI